MNAGQKHVIALKDAADPGRPDATSTRTQTPPPTPAEGVGEWGMPYPYVP